MGRFTTVLFDLDGTLSDPFEGLSKSIRETMTRMGLPVPSDEALRHAVGPPPRESFAALLQTTDKEKIETAIRYYRERYATVGLFENHVYPGIPKMLEQLRAANLRLFITTSKVNLYARRILDHFRLSQFFAGIYGSEADGRFERKPDLMRHLIEDEGLDPASTAMVGDRSHDVEAARANGVFSVGVLWGFGSREELEDAGVNTLVSSVEDLVPLLTAE